MLAITLADFRNPTKLSLWVKILSYFCIAASLFSLFANYIEYDFYQKQLTDYFINDEIAAVAQETQEKWVTTAGFLQSASFFQYFIFLLWVYRINKNTRAIAQSDMKYSPIWSILWFGIPIANLYKPYFVVRELWTANHSSPILSQSKNAKFIVFFWIFAVTSLTLSQGLFKFGLKADELSQLILQNKLTVISDILDIMFFVFTIILVTKIHKLHMIKFSPHEQEYHQLISKMPLGGESSRKVLLLSALILIVSGLAIIFS
jgi:hypothetical protein